MKHFLILALFVALSSACLLSQDRSSQSPQPPATLDVLSDTGGVDFGPYLAKVLHDVREHWYLLIPNVARAPIKKKGKVDIEFAIAKDGHVEGMRTVGRSNDVALDRAAWGGIAASSPFAQLPSEYSNAYLALRLHFLYNCTGEDCPTHNCKGEDCRTNEYLESHNLQLLKKTDDLRVSPSSVELAAAANQKFSVSQPGRNVLTLALWSLSGNGCKGESCGTISGAGLYTAPHELPDPPVVWVRATLVSDPTKSASAVIHLVKVGSSQ